MRTLDKPTRDLLADYDVCVDRAPTEDAKARLRAARATVEALYQAYDAGGWNFDNQLQITGLCDDTLNDLLGSYQLTHRRRPLGDLREQLLLAAKKVCPYCQLEDPGTLDHFLAKSSYQPFAFYALNLSPMCSICNNLKGTKGSAAAHQFFTHAYFDQIPSDERFLLCQIAVGRRHVATNFSIDFSAAIEPSILQRLSYQFSILRLGARYQLAAVDVLREMAEAVAEQRAAAAPEAKIQDLVKKAANDAGSGPHVIHWRRALLAALSASEPFLRDGYKLLV